MSDTEAGHESRSAAADRAAQTVNWVGGIGGAWLFAYPHPYALACAASLLVPLWAIGVLFIYRPLVGVEEEKNSPVPSITVGLFLPAVALVIRGLLDIELVEHAPFWPLMIVVTFLTAGVLALGNRRPPPQASRRTTIRFAIGMIAVAYGYGAPYILNAAFDPATPTEYRTAVLSQRVRGGKGSTYYLNVGPWGTRRAANDITVHKAYYHRVQPGDSVTIRVSPGLLGVPWFKVAE